MSSNSNSFDDSFDDSFDENVVPPPPPPMGGMPKPPDMMEMYTRNHDYHDNFKAILYYFKQLEGSMDYDECPQEYSIHTWYD